MSEHKFRIGTRKSALALAQSEMIAAALRSVSPDCEIEICRIVTTGDKKQLDVHAARDKQEWILEIEEALVAERIDIAVHSGKDVPAVVAKETKLHSVLNRASPFDSLILHPKHRAGIGSKESILDTLPKNACVGTASLRRKAQLLRLRPDLRIEAIRGNVPTRIQKLKDSQSMDAIVLAQAGLDRLSLEAEMGQELAPSILLPAVNQGILALQVRCEDSLLEGYLEELSVDSVQAVWLAERSAIATLGADCGSCVAVFAETEGDKLQLRAQVLDGEGTQVIEGRGSGLCSEASEIGERIARQLISEGAAALL